MKLNFSRFVFQRQFMLQRHILLVAELRFEAAKQLIFFLFLPWSNQTTFPPWGNRRHFLKSFTLCFFHTFLAKLPWIIVEKPIQMSKDISMVTEGFTWGLSLYSQILNWSQNKSLLQV